MPLSLSIGEEAFMLQGKDFNPRTITAIPYTSERTLFSGRKRSKMPRLYFGLLPISLPDTSQGKVQAIVEV
jgi:hypothetical protein